MDEKAAVSRVYDEMTALLEVYAENRLKWVKLARSKLSLFPAKVAGANDPMFFLENAIAEFLEEYDRDEEFVRKEFLSLQKTWREYFIVNKLVEANIKTAVEVAIRDKRAEINDFVKKTSEMSKEWLSRCDNLKYKGNYKAVLEVLRDQTATQVIYQFIIKD